MSKQFFCAECGARLEIMQKAIPRQGKVINLVKPHFCEDTNETFEFDDSVQKSNEAFIHKESPDAEKTKLNDLFDSFNFVQKLNKASEVEPMTIGPGDLRPKPFQREEISTSSAPLTVLNRAPREAGLTPITKETEKEFKDAD